MIPPTTSNFEFHFVHAQVEYLLKCAVKVELTTGDDPMSDPLLFMSFILLKHC